MWNQEITSRNSSLPHKSNAASQYEQLPGKAFDHTDATDTSDLNTQAWKVLMDSYYKYSLLCNCKKYTFSLVHFKSIARWKGQRFFNKMIFFFFQYTYYRLNFLLT